jgi:catechol 2,3-dioxygenase-like lactoylglutathione lyase family enzyme
MFNDTDPIATLAVKDLDTARRFYEETLGLERIPTQEPVLSYRCGGSSLLVYQSDYAGTNRATAVTWIIEDDLAGLIDTLKGKGVAFERYDMPGTTHDGEMHVFGTLRNAWFTDPDGNIHSLVSRS